MAVSSNRILNTLIAANSTQQQRHDPFFRIGATMGSLYAVDDEGRIPDEFSRLLQNMDAAGGRSAQRTVDRYDD